jgi:hypothetical protein
MQFALVFFYVLYIRKQQVNVLSYDTKGNLAFWSLLQLLDILNAEKLLIAMEIESIPLHRYDLC